MPVYHQGEDRYRVKVSHKGKVVYRRFQGTQKEALAYEVRLIAQIDNEDPALDLRNVPTLKIFSLGQYAIHAETRLKKRTWSNRQYQIRTLIDHLGELKLGEISFSAVEGYQQARLKDGIRPATINDDIKALKAILSYARKRGHELRPLETSDLPVRVKGARSKQAWTVEQVQGLLGAVLKVRPQIYPLVLFLANTGCRKGEALALEWSHVDLKRRLISIEPGPEWQPKDGEAREVPISDSLHAMLSRPRLDERWVFPHVNKSQRHKAGRYAFFPQRYFDKARKKAKLTGGPHSLRHFYASQFLAKRPDIYLLSRILGHADTKITTKIYAHLLPDHLNRAHEAVDVSSDVSAAEAEAMGKWGKK